jgi:hypothetical protein
MAIREKVWWNKLLTSWQGERERERERGIDIERQRENEISMLVQVLQSPLWILPQMT